MAKGEIVQHLGEGLYRVRQKLAVERIQKEIDLLSSRIAQLAIQIPEAKLAKLEKENHIEQVKGYLDEWILLYQQDPDEHRDDLIANQKVLIRLSGELRKLEFYLSDLVAENLSANKRRNQLQSVPAEKEIEAWCADYSEELLGNVGLIDINDEGGQGTVIQPGFEGSAQYLPARDGALFPDLAQSGAQIYYNLAILPGVQKWMPRYRVGTISNIVNDTCVVVLAPANSSAQGLDINQFSLYSDVPIQYMNCNGDAFSEGDKVVIRFFDTGPQVVGFESNPRPCLIPGFAFIPAEATGQSSGPVTFGKPFTDINGDPINPNLGTEGSAKSMWAAGIRPGRDQYSYVKGLSPEYGNMNWVGADDTTLSWSGPGSRIFDFRYAEIEGTSVGWRDGWNLAPRVYFKNRTLVNFGAGLLNGKDLVIGAAVHNSRLLVVTVSDVIESPAFALYRFTLDEGFTEATSPEVIATYTPPENLIQFRSGVYFSESGATGVCTLREDNYTKVFALRVSEAGGFVRELVHDALDGTGTTATTETDCTYTVTRDEFDTITDIVWDETVVTTAPAVDVPLYFDYRGETEITVYHSMPSATITTTSAGSGGPPPQEVDSTRTTTAIYSGSEKITTSAGDTLAEIIAPRSRSYSLDVALLPDSGNMQVTLNDSFEDRNGLNFSDPSFDILCINARDRICAIRYDLIDYAGSGTNPDAFAEPSGFSYVFNISTYTAEEITTRRLDVFSEGSRVSSQDVSVETRTENGKIVGENLWYAPDYVQTETGSGTYSNTDTFKPNTPRENSYFHPELNDFGGAEHAGRVAVSVLHQDGNGAVSYQHLEGVGDPVSTIFGKQPGDPYVMHRLSLV